MTPTFTTTRPLFCSACQGTIEPGERYTYAEIGRGAKVSVHERCKEAKK